MDENRIDQHPSYAQISASRMSSNPPQTMYGSKLRHGHYISISIAESECQRSLNRDSHYSRRQIIQVRMSETQFAQFITSMNVGGGTPCTIERLQGKEIPSPDFVNERETISAEFENAAEQVAQSLQTAVSKLKALTAPGSKLNKAAIGEILSDVEHAQREISANMPFIEEQFQEAVEHIVTTARADIEAFLAHGAMRYGLESAPNPNEVITLLPPGDVNE